MAASRRTIEGDWHPGTVPENVQVHDDAYVETSYSFSRCRSRVVPAVSLELGSSAYLGTMFDLGPEARLTVGRYALLNGVRLICDLEVTIGDHCLLSWNVVVMDTYRVPVDAGQRRARLVAGLPLADGLPRPVHIEDNVWVGLESCILPGVTIGEGSVVAARAVVFDDVPPYSVAAGNPARVVRRVDPGMPGR